MELSTHADVLTIFSNFIYTSTPTQIVTKAILKAGTGNLMTVDDSWAESEGIPISAAYPVRAYVCISATDKGNTISLTVRKGHDNIYLSKPFSTLHLNAVKSGTITTTYDYDIPTTAVDINLGLLLLTNMGAYWAVKTTTPSMTFKIDMAMDGVATILEVIVTS